MNHWSSVVATLASWALVLAICAAPASAAAMRNNAANELDDLVAPIALYPDALVSQILTCATKPDQVTQVNAWLRANPELKGTAVQEAADQQGFDASFIAIVLFPDVLQAMADKPDWTRRLGAAFTSVPGDVLDAVQRLRSQAINAGTLKSSAQLDVETVPQDGQTVIVIQPANPQVVYVPQYDPAVVYTTPSNDAAAAAVIGFTAGVILAAVVDNNSDHFYYRYGGWGYRGPICYRGGWNNYADHRRDMANDYYRHRENMVGQRNDNRSDRRGAVQDNRSDRRDATRDNQSGRQETRSGRQGSREATQAGRQDNRGGRQGNREATQTGRQDNRGGRQGNREATQAGRQDNRGGRQAGRSTREVAGSRGQASRQRQPSGAFGGYQRGATERASSARGSRSMSRRSAGSSRGGRRR